MTSWQLFNMHNTQAAWWITRPMLFWTDFVSLQSMTNHM